MATNRRRPGPAPDPAQMANEQVLARRDEIIESKMRPVPDLDLGLKENEPATAADMLTDEWDKKAFGDAPKTITRWVYGPHRLLDFPGMKEAIEKYGREDLAERYRLAIVQKGAAAQTDPVMRQALHRSISRFGVEKVAEAMAQKILEIPARQVDYELDTGEFGDPELMGSNALKDCVAKYGHPGMSVRFMSDRCIGVLGMRGYEVVKMPNGDPVKAGTLIMTEIPKAIAERRAARYAQESRDQVAAQQENYMQTQERLVRAAGPAAAGWRPLDPLEVVRGNASESEQLLGEALEMGVKVEHEADKAA